MYLETFRLPGEAPVISYLLEHFADHWHVSVLKNNHSQTSRNKQRGLESDLLFCCVSRK